ncbi:MAG: hypothetical protein JW725_00275 [Candidatus Babeliaceae bacterium]|nr:hypothetical protein [Candidatus Babeliaceae bacterium]
MSIYDYRDRPAYRSDVFKPYKNQNISKWWGKDQDNLIKLTIGKWQWNWYWEISDIVISHTSEETIASFMSTTNLNNKIMYFAVSRAQELGLTNLIRKPKWKVCPLCHNKFIENSLPHPLIKRLGIDQIDFCSPCLRDTILQNTGSQTASKEEVLAYLRELVTALQRIPHQGYGEGINDFKGLNSKERLELLQIFQKKPSTRHVKKLFGTWLQALIDAGILEDDVRRTSRGIQCIAKDGHVCLSIGEKTIDDFLYANGITHNKEPYYPEGKYRADFDVNGVFIEYFGLAGNPDYDKKTKLKQKLCKKYGVTLISLFPSDLVSDSRLDVKILNVLKQ